MPIASFSNKIFQVSSDKVHTFDDLQYGTALDTEKQDNPGKKPKTYIKGPDLSTLNIKIKVSADMGLNPRAEIGSWMALKDAKKPYPFIIGGRPFGAGRWLLKDVQADGFKIDNTGNVLAATINLSFEEYVYAGTAKAEGEKKSAGKKTGQETSAVYNALSPSQKRDLRMESRYGIRN